MKNTTLLYIIGGITLLLFILRNKINAAMSRGLRNKNPGNIRLTPGMWKGEVKGTDKDFKTFKSMAYGYRAIFVLLRGYFDKGYNTVSKIINRYAPSSENQTDSYIASVCGKVGVSPDTVLDFNDPLQMKRLVKAISFVENGVAAEDIEVENGYKLLYA
jgi:hypothetical protein